jgi:hypothetical protein
MTTKPRSLVVRLVSTSAAVACVTAALLAGEAGAQPRRADAPPPPPPSQVESADRMRERVEARLAEVRKEEALLQDALRALDQGEPPASVFRDVMRGARDERFERFGDGPDERPIELGELTPERRSEIMAFINEMTPQLGERIERELEENPDRADAIFMRLAPRVLPQIELRERDPELFDLRAASMRLDWQIRAGAMAMRRAQGEEATAEARERLKGLIAQRVDLTIKERALMIDRFERRVASMREDLAKERERSDAIVEEKLGEIERGEFRGPDDRDRRGGPPGRRDGRPDRGS